MEWKSIDEAESGRVYLAWLGGAMLPSYQLISKGKKSGCWIVERDRQRLKKSMITAICDLPLPPGYEPK